MNVIGISGSPRKNGNTEYLIQQALGEISQHGIETTLIRLPDFKIADCQGCEACRDTFTCIINDDMQKLYPLLNRADAVILGSPTYFYDVTAFMKAFLDRLYCFEVFDSDDRSVWMSVNEALGGKLAAVISVCEQTRIEDTGYAVQTMQLTLESLGYRVVDCVKALNLYNKGEAGKAFTTIEQVISLGRKLSQTMLLKQKIYRRFQEKNINK